MAIAAVVRAVPSILTMLATVAALLAVFLPWGAYDADRTGPACPDGNPFCYHEAAASYKVTGREYTLSDSSSYQNTSQQTSWDSDVHDDDAGITALRWGGRALIAALPAIILGAIAFQAGFLRHPQAHLAPALGNVLAWLGLALWVLGLVLFLSGMLDHVDAQREDPRGDLSVEPGAFSLGSGFLLALTAAVLLGAVGALTILSRPREVATTSAADVDDDPADADDPLAAVFRLGPEPVGPDEAEAEVDASEATSERLVVPAGADEEGRPPRNLVCPRCREDFVGQWGVKPLCPHCGYTKTG